MRTEARQLFSYWLVALYLVCGVLACATAQSLVWLDAPEGGRSEAYGVSADGSVVIGITRDAQGRTRAFRWTRATGVQPVETFPDTTHSEARGVSADGRVVVGWVNRGQGEYAFRWSIDSGCELLGELARRAYGVSADGRVVVGWTQTGAPARTFRWTPETGVQLIRDGFIEAWGVSADGRTIVGRMPDVFGAQACRWNEQYGLQPLGVPANGLQSYAYAASADGRVVVGAWMPRGVMRVRAFRWSEARGMHLITPDDEWLSDARGVSADGTLVVGIAAYYAHGRAFRWSPETGAENLNEVFGSLLTDSSHLANAFAISPDGRYIVGVGHNGTTMRHEAFLLDTWRRGDTNGDYRIDDADLLAVLLAFGTGGSGTTRHEDINNDGLVDDTDLLTVLFEYDGGD
ncbi:MAG: hypothetical protein NZ874_06240 [Fimbriimonadales bacterium]|nr:hypothetical protein [Fimbriimonadales bacterium]